MSQTLTGTKVHSAIRRSILTWVSRLLFVLNIIAGFYSLIAYFAIHVSPIRFWLAGFITLTIPVLLICHVLFILCWLLISPLKSLLSMVLLLIGFPLLQRTYAFHPHADPGPSKDSTQFKVLSYNTRLLNMLDYYGKGNKEKSVKQLDWIRNNDADIKCLQEFFNEDDSPVFNSISRISGKGSYNYYMTPLFRLNNKSRGFYGVAIFTKFPIVGSGDIIFDRRTLNKGVFVDIVIHQDTVRVFNVHLYSMSIVPDSLGTKKDYASIKRNYADITKRLRRGLVTRSRQIEVLEKYIKASPYKVIVCGDFNEVPYSYVYQQMRRRLSSSFEDAGNGFGFTLNNALFFLRIDNQFYDKRLKVDSFETHRDIPYSDHFPISATYSLQKEK